MSSIDSMSCCGTHEITGIINDANPKITIKTVCKDLFINEENCAFMIFTDIDKKKHGNKLEKYIKDNKLGKTTKSISKINPNSNNSLAIWTWALNKTNLRTWWNKNRPNDYDF